VKRRRAGLLYSRWIQQPLYIHRYCCQGGACWPPLHPSPAHATAFTHACTHACCARASTPALPCWRSPDALPACLACCYGYLVRRPEGGGGGFAARNGHCGRRLRAHFARRFSAEDGWRMTPSCLSGMCWRCGGDAFVATWRDVSSLRWHANLYSALSPSICLCWGRGFFPAGGNGV